MSTQPSIGPREFSGFVRVAGKCAVWFLLATARASKHCVWIRLFNDGKKVGVHGLEVLSSSVLLSLCRGHKIYLSTAPNYDFPTFRELVREVTQEFKRISEGMMDIERRLRLNDNSGHLAEYVRALQEEEKVKLELTAKLQLAKQDLLDNPDEYKNQADVASMKARLNEVVERINDNLMELKYEMNGM